jgi:hypothetical protein
MNDSPLPRQSPEFGTGDYQSRGSDVLMLKKSLEGGWPITPAIRSLVVEVLAEDVKNPLLSPKQRHSAALALQRAIGDNIDLMRILDKMNRLDANLPTDILADGGGQMAAEYAVRKSQSLLDSLVAKPGA